MSRFFEVTVIYKRKHIDGFTSEHSYKKLFDLDKVVSIDDCNGYNICLADNCSLSVSKESYDSVCEALLPKYSGGSSLIEKLNPHIEKLESNNIVDKLCELQNDHTWVMQAMGNLLFILRQSDDRAPKVLLNCCDKDMEALSNECFKAARAQSKRIKELEARICLMQEPKRCSND